MLTRVVSADLSTLATTPILADTQWYASIERWLAMPTRATTLCVWGAIGCGKTFGVERAAAAAHIDVHHFNVDELAEAKPGDAKRARARMEAQVRALASTRGVVASP